MLALRRLDPNHYSNIEKGPGSSNWDTPFTIINLDHIQFQYLIIFCIILFTNV